MIGFFVLLALSSAGFFAGFRACVVAYDKGQEVSPWFVIPMTANGLMVVGSAALLLGEVLR
jgi:hypothetical protein